jgi:flagellar basal-body rod modification protein FlgD
VASALAPEARVKATAKNATTSGDGTGNSTTDNSTISSNDFLTLLVNELKNQDPTQPTDPNQYITQLAQVNSLQQLISINQGIGTLDTTIAGISSPSTGSSGSGSSTTTG